jgi:uncharacterized LabA/DUF88 family protein
MGSDMALINPYTGPREISYLFVDGGALRGRLKNVCAKWFGGVSVDIDFRNLKGSFTKAFYYDALPVREEGESEKDYSARIEPHRAVLDAAASVDGMHVYEGDARRRRKRGMEQKKVDVMLAVDMLTHSFRKNMHKATLLTGDNDFKPLIDALVQDGMFVTLWYPVGETSRELMQAADARQRLDMRTLHSLLTQESRERLSLPGVEVVNQDSGLPGISLGKWSIERRILQLVKTANAFVVTRAPEPVVNRLQVTHHNVEFLREFCLDSFDIEIPDHVIATATQT